MASSRPRICAPPQKPMKGATRWRTAAPAGPCRRGARRGADPSASASGARRPARSRTRSPSRSSRSAPRWAAGCSARGTARRAADRRPRSTRATSPASSLGGASSGSPNAPSDRAYRSSRRSAGRSLAKRPCRNFAWYASFVISPPGVVRDSADGLALTLRIHGVARIGRSSSARYADDLADDGHGPGFGQARGARGARHDEAQRADAAGVRQRHEPTPERKDRSRPARSGSLATATKCRPSSLASSV